MNLKKFAPQFIISSLLTVLVISLLFRNYYATDIKHAPKRTLQNHGPTNPSSSSSPFDLSRLKELFDSGDEAYNAGNIQKAAHYYSHILKHYPLITEAFIRLGKTFTRQRKHNLATRQYETALLINPHNVDTYLLLAQSLRAQNKFAEAAEICKHALKLQPKLHLSYLELVKIYSDQHQYEDALEALDRAQELVPDNAQLYVTRGHLLNWKGNIAGAVDMYKKAIALDPKCSSAHYNLGHTLKVYRQFNEAIESLKTAAQLNPSHVDTHIALSHAYWALGDFANAWKEYEWRWKQYKKDPRIPAIPEWQGEKLEEKTILIYGEQGLGDTLQFIRFAQNLKDRGAHVWCKIQKPLINLLSQSPFIDHIITQDSDMNKIDYQVALMSLPGKLNLTPQTIPSPTKYLYSDKELSNMWQKELKKDTKIKVGICWAVDSKHEIYKLPIQKRSCPLNEFCTLAHNNKISLYSLQLVDDVISKSIPAELNLHTFDKDFDKQHGNFMDSAAVIEHLDLIISADTAIAHLAAGLGKPVWLLLPYSSDCRWYLAENTTPWYPTIKIFRQPEPGNWHKVLSNVADSIKHIEPHVQV